MPKCEYCGKEVLFPFMCPYCGKTFCAEHRLPENHQCPNMPKEGFWYQKKRTMEERATIAEREALMSGNEMCPKCGSLSTDIVNYDAKTITFKCLKCEYKWTRLKSFPYSIIEPKEQKLSQVPEQKPYRSKKKLIATFLAFFVILILVGAITAYASYNFGYNAGYDVGHSQGYFDGNSSGYEIGYDAGYIRGVTDGAGRGYNIRDPTYQEALQFITLDQTDKNQYSEENYTCTNFAADFKNNAFQVGYRCGYVEVEFPNSAHAIVCFNTTDRGLIFIEPQDDAIVTLSIGQPYWDRTKYEPTYDDTVIRFLIVW